MTESLASCVVVTYNTHRCLGRDGRTDPERIAPVLEEGRYGNALLARHPMRLVKARTLPGVPQRGDLEPRGALWAEVELPGTALQVLTTHLGLTAREKAVQTDALLGKERAGDPTFSPPGVVLGDLSEWGSSRVARSAAARTPATVRVSDHLPVVAGLVLQRDMSRG